MNQPFGKYLMFKNRLEKVYRHISKLAAKQGITCFRIYDHDLPEFPFLIEFYEGNLYIAEYKRRHSLSDEHYEEWMHQSKNIINEVLNIGGTNIFLKLRQRKDHRISQYEKLQDKKAEFIVHESGLRFSVNLSDYLDTGLFLDH